MSLPASASAPVAAPARPPHLPHTVEVGSSGPPVIVLHGGPGLDHTYLRPWLDPLAATARLIYIDLTGHGRSARPQRWEDVTHATWVHDVERVRQELGLEQVTVFGHSYGAYIALEYAVTHGDRLAGLILCEGAPVMDFADAMDFSRATPEQMEAIASGFSGPAERTPEEFGRLFRTILPLYFHGPVPEPVFDVFSRTRFSPGAFNRGYFECFPGYNVLLDLERLSAPVLLLHGRQDCIVPLGPGGERLHRLLPNSTLAVFEESGHFPFVEEPDRFLAAVRTWLRAQPQARVAG